MAAIQKGVLALTAVLLLGCATADGSGEAAAPGASQPLVAANLPPDQAVRTIELIAEEHRKHSACIAEPVRESLGALQGLAVFAGPDMPIDRRARTFEIIYRQFNTAEALLVPCRVLRDTAPPPVSHSGLRTLITESRAATEQANGKVEILIREGRRQTTLVTQGNRLDLTAFVNILRDASVALVEIDVQFRERRRPLLPEESIGRSVNEARIHLGRTLSIAVQRTLAFEDAADLQKRGVEAAAGFRQAIVRERADLRILVQQFNSLPANMQEPARQMSARIENTMRLEEELATAFEDYFQSRNPRMPDTVSRLVREVEASDARLLTDMPDLLRRLMGTPAARV